MHAQHVHTTNATCPAAVLVKEFWNPCQATKLKSQSHLGKVVNRQAGSLRCLQTPHKSVLLPCSPAATHLHNCRLGWTERLSVQTDNAAMRQLQSQESMHAARQESSAKESDQMIVQCIIGRLHRGIVERPLQRKCGHLCLSRSRVDSHELDAMEGAGSAWRTIS